MRFADPTRPSETVREMVERRWPEDSAVRMRGRCTARGPSRARFPPNQFMWVSAKSKARIYTKLVAGLLLWLIPLTQVRLYVVGGAPD